MRFRWIVDPDNPFFWSEMPGKLEEALAVKRNAPAQFDATYQGRPVPEGGVIFSKSDFSYYEPFDSVRPKLQAGGFLLQSWDTAFSAKRSANPSVCVTALCMPCEQPHHGENDAEPHLDVYILSVYRAKLDYAEVQQMAMDMYNYWRPDKVLIEKRATGEPIIQHLQGLGVPVEEVMPTTSKRNRAVMGIGSASTQGWYRRGRVLHPYEADWLATFEKELLDWRGLDTDEDDQVDATVQLVNHAIQLSSGGGILGMEDEPIERIGPPGLAEYGEVLRQMIYDPFEETCSNCKNWRNGWCEIHHRGTVALDSCERFESRLE